MNFRVESDLYKSRESDNMWLVRHLEIVRKFCVEDLLLVKSECSLLFPTDYEIFDLHVEWYHEALMKHVSTFVKCVIIVSLFLNRP